MRWSIVLLAATCLAVVDNTPAELEGLTARKARLAQELGNLGKQIAALRKLVQP